MSCIAFTALSVVAAITKIAGRVTVSGTVILAIFFLLVANYRAWKEQHDAKVELETAFYFRRPRLAIVTPTFAADLWDRAYASDLHPPIFLLTHVFGDPAEFITIQVVRPVNESIQNSLADVDVAVGVDFIWPRARHHCGACALRSRV